MVTFIRFDSRLLHTILTVQPFGIVLQSSLKVKFLLTCPKVEEVIPEYDRVSLSELGVSPCVESRQAPGVPFCDPHRCAVVSRVVGTLGNPKTNSGHILMPR